MKAQSPQFHQSLPRRSFVCVTLLVICAMLAHSFDACATHLGDPFAFSTVTQQSAQQTTRQADELLTDELLSCEVCLSHDKSHSDACDLLSESAVLNSASQQHPEYQAVILSATVAVIPAMPQVIALSGCLHGRAGPPPAAPLSVVLRSTLPSRAPPRSA